MKQLICKIFGLREEMPLSFYMADFFFRKFLRINADVPWAVHHTSRVINAKNITRGINVFPGDSPGNFIDASNGISLGDYTNIGPNVGLITANHNLINNAIYDPAPPIKIGKFCWIGMNVVILPGVELGDFTIVGAGAVVSKSFTEGYCVIGGVPAQIINHLDKNACDEFSRTKYQR